MSNNQVYVAFYKGKARRLSEMRAHILDFVIRVGTLGKYSHCEIAVAIGNGLYQCMSSSPRDGGVRSKTMPLPDDRWDLIEVDISPKTATDFYSRNKGKKYDWRAIATFLIPFIKFNQKNKWFCSEYCADNIGLSKPSRYSPNSLYKHLTKRK